MERVYRYIDRDEQARVLLDNLAAWEREHLAQTLNRDAAPDGTYRAAAAARLAHLERCIEVAEAMLQNVTVGVS